LKIRLLTGFAIVCVLISVGVVPSGRASATTTLFSDNFQNGFTVGNFGDPAVNWAYFAAGPFVGNDGITSTGPDGLTVDSKGVNPHTGKPAFTLTVPQDSQLPGTFDHVKWLVYANQFSSHGFPGFDAPAHGELVCQATVSGETFGTENNPFHQYVTNPNDDLRLAAIALPNIDFDTFNVFDTWLTNEYIYAFYEHLPFQRHSLGGAYGEYAAYSSVVRIAKRSPNKVDTVAFAYDKEHGTARWLVNGVEKWRVPVTIGHRPPSSMILIDHGGQDTNFSPNQIDCGMGTFTLLDGYGPKGKGLVRLNNPAGPPNYYNPATGPHPDDAAPSDADFVDNQSLPQDRLWGQGAELHVSNFSVQYWNN